MKNIILFILLGYICSPLIWAQCWDGSSSNGPVACPPPPNVPGSPVYQGSNGRAAPQPQAWATRWGAIAHDLNIPTAGVSENEQNKSQAEVNAIRACRNHGGINCHISLVYDNECAAVAQQIGGGGLNSSAAATKEMAERQAIRNCQNFTGAACELKYSACSLPARIR